MKKSNILPPFLNTAICAVLVIVAVLGCTEPEPTPGPTNPDDKDTKAPTITLVTSAVGVYGGKTVAVADGMLSIGETEVAIWTDDKSEVSKCKADLAFTASATGSKSEAITSGATLDKAGTLNLSVTDEAGNSSSKDITLTEDNSAPEVAVLKDNVDVYGGKAVTAADNTLSIGDEPVLQWTDDHGDECTLALELDGTPVNLCDEVSTAGTLKITVTDSKGLGTEASIILTENNSAPEVAVLKDNVDVYGGKTVTAADNTLSIGAEPVLQWTDDHGDECTLALELDGTSVNLCDEVSTAGTLKITVTDSKGLGTEASIILTENNSAPEVTIHKEYVNVFGGKAVTINGNVLSIGEDAVLQWNDDHGDECTLALDLDSTSVNIGDDVSTAGTLKITISDSKGLGTEASITLTDQIVFGMESLDGLDLQIDKEVNLISGLSFYEGWSLAKVEIEKDGVRTEVTEPEHYTPAIAGNIVVIITLTDGSKTAEFKSGTLTVKPMSYTAIQPQKSEIYPDFNTANVEAQKRWGIYELRALAMSMHVRDGVKIIIFREGKYIPDYGIYPWMGGNGDGHGEEIYRIISEGTGDIDNILATKETWTTFYEIVSNSIDYRDEQLIMSCSRELFGEPSLEELFNHGQYPALKHLSSLDNILIFDAAGNVNSYINYNVNEDVLDLSGFNNGRYCGTSAADLENNNLIPVTYGRFKGKARFGVYQDQDGRGCTSACAYISKDNSISPFGCVEFSNPQCKNRNEEWSEGRTSYATPALAAMAKNAYDILHNLGSVQTMTELKWMLLKYSTKIPATRQDIAADGTIIEDVDNGFVLVPDMLRLINEEIYPAIIGKASKTTDGTTLLHKDDGLNIAYSGAGTEYQAADGSWKSTDGVAITEFFGKPQRFNPALLAKYGITGPAAITIHLTDQSGLEIVSSEVALP